MADLESLQHDEVLDLWVDVLHNEGLEKINRRLWADLLDYEWARICHVTDGFEYFLRWYGSIRVKGRGDGTGWQRFCPNGEPRVSAATGKDWAWQLALAGLIPWYDVWALEKTRQVGLTFIEADYALWFAGTKKEQPVLLLSNKLPSAKRLLRRCHVDYARLPDWLKERMRMTSGAMELTTFANGSTIEPLASSSDTGRSEAAGLIIADEWAYVERQEDVHASIDAAAGDGGQVIYSSTCNGASGLFFDWAQEGAAGRIVGWLSDDLPVYQAESGMAWTFVGDLAHPDRTVETRAKTMLRFKGSLKKFQQEHPLDWMEGFIASGTNYHDSTTLMRVEKRAMEIYEPLERRGTLLWQDKDNRIVTWMDDPTGMITLHAPMSEIEDARKSERPWVICADCAGDAPWGDFHAGTAWHSGLIQPATALTDEQILVPHRELITIHGYADADAYADLLIRMGYWLNEALVVPEANAIGIAVIHYIRNAKYPRLFRRRPTSERQERAPQALYGFWMGGGQSGSKSEAYGELERMLRVGEAELRDVEGIRELRQVRFLGGGRIGVPEPGHDDRADAKAIAATSIRYARSLHGAQEIVAPDVFKEHLKRLKHNRSMLGKIGTQTLDPRILGGVTR